MSELNAKTVYTARGSNGDCEFDMFGTPISVPEEFLEAYGLKKVIAFGVQEHLRFWAKDKANLATIQECDILDIGFTVVDSEGISRHIDPDMHYRKGVIERRHLRTCPDCAAKPGEIHMDNCDVERCSVCGGQRFGCDCEGHDKAFARWTGIWPGVLEAEHMEIDLNGLYSTELNKVIFVKPGGAPEPVIPEARVEALLQVFLDQGLMREEDALYAMRMLRDPEDVPKRPRSADLILKDVEKLKEDIDSHAKSIHDGVDYPAFMKDLEGRMHEQPGNIALKQVTEDMEEVMGKSLDDSSLHERLAALDILEKRYKQNKPEETKYDPLEEEML